MAEPTYISSGAYFDGSSVSPAFAVPAGTAAGRVVLIPIFIDGNPLPSNPTPPAGFALAPGMPVQLPATSGSHSLYLYWKRLTGADAGTYGFTLPTSRYLEAQAHLYDNVVASGTPFDPSPGFAFETTNSTTTPAISCTSAGPDRRLILTATNWSGGTWTAGTGHTKRMQGAAGVITLTDRSWPIAGPTGSVTATCTGSDKRNAWIGALIGTTPDASGVEGAIAAGLPALGGQAAGKVTVSGAAAATLPSLNATATGAVSVFGPTNADLPALAGTLAAAATATANLAAQLPPLAGSLQGTARATGNLTATLPALTGLLDAAARSSGALAAGLPALTATLQGTVTAPPGELAARLPALTGALTGTSAATDLPDVTMSVGAPALGWPVGRPDAGWPVRPARTGWPVRPPHLGE